MSEHRPPEQGAPCAGLQVTDQGRSAQRCSPVKLVFLPDLVLLIADGQDSVPAQDRSTGQWARSTGQWAWQPLLLAGPLTAWDVGLTVSEPRTHSDTKTHHALPVHQARLETGLRGRDITVRSLTVTEWQRCAGHG